MKKGNELLYGIGAVVVIILIVTLMKSPNLQSVVGVDCPEYKTNMEPGTIGLSNSWISVDCNGDGVYEAYGYTGQVSSISYRHVTGQITEINKEYYCFDSAGGMMLYIYQGATTGTISWIYGQDTGSSYLADLTCGDGTIPDPDPDPDPTLCISDSEFPGLVSRWLSQEGCG